MTCPRSSRRARRLSVFPAFLPDLLEPRVLLAAELVKDLQTVDTPIVNLVSCNGVLYFNANLNGDGYQLWKTDGTANNTSQMATAFRFPYDYTYYDKRYVNWMPVKDTVMFADRVTNSLWKASGADATVVAEASHFVDENLEDLVNLNKVSGQFFFEQLNATSTHGSPVVVAVWTSDGTPAGTVPVFSGEDYGYYEQRSFGDAMLGKTIYFAGSKDFTNYQLWKSDGSAAGTSLVKAVSASSVTNANGKLFFFSDDDNKTGELWTSDGTTAGTAPVATLKPKIPLTGLEWSEDMTVADGRVYFKYIADYYSAGSETYEQELWTSDGTAAGTRSLGPIGDLSLTASAAIGKNLLFWRDDGVHGVELWKTDGTVAGTSMLKDIRPGSKSSTDNIAVQFLNFKGAFYFAANDGSHGMELWKTDGTSSGTVMVKDLRPGSAGASPAGITDVYGTLFFAANDGQHGTELWKSDGSSAGTTLAQDINHGTPGSDPSSLLTFNGALYFAATDATHGSELWKIDFASLENHVLRIRATDAADTLSVTIRSGTLRVRSNGQLRTFTSSEVKRIEVFASGGNDIIDFSGIAIPTYVDAGTGNDMVTAGSGADSLTGGAGKDTLSGGEGDDRINGNGTNDRLFGEGGNDRIYGGAHNDFIDGGGGVDRVWGETGNDTISGGSSNDKLDGGPGDDSILGGKGNDLLVCGGGVDALFGNDGDDLFAASDGVKDMIDGGVGADTAESDETIDQLLKVERAT